MFDQLRATPYFRQVQLLVRLIPYVAKESCFALKGGTAINLFVRDLPRLSIDIDLAYLPLHPREQALQEAKSALRRIMNRLNRQQGFMAMMQSDQPDALRLLVKEQSAQIKIEVSPVSRGTLHPAVLSDVTESVEEHFGFASIHTETLPDLYGGKICAALDRQHPRDLFDVKLLLEAGELGRNIFEGFIVYLISHPRPMAELLAPNFKPLQPIFNNEFKGMTRVAVSEADLQAARIRLLKTLKEHMTPDDASLLLSIKQGAPNWPLFAHPHIQDLPAIKWKLHNIQKMNEKKRAQALEKLTRTLDDWLACK